MRATWRQLIGWSAGWWRGGCLPPLAARRTPHRTTVAAGGRSLPSAVAERLGLRVATPYHSGPQIDPRNRPISLFQPHILIELRTSDRVAHGGGEKTMQAAEGGYASKQASRTPDALKSYETAAAVSNSTRTSTKPYKTIRDFFRKRKGE